MDTEITMRSDGALIMICITTITAAVEATAITIMGTFALHEGIKRRKIEKVTYLFDYIELFTENKLHMPFFLS
jgi:hypothetical protein